MTDYTSPQIEGHVTQEMIDACLSIVEGWYNEGRKDWADIWDRLDGTKLEDGTCLDLPTDLRSPVYAKLKREVRKTER
ncbi:hypothetical protein ACN20G_29830 (plasmid) [Streptomyces sp. BI20]|uniref:hypothetical protein n=1 Tax=Streptomyces sp. BI20 TaxID=3403460 RepID=UPI003C72CA9D